MQKLRFVQSEVIILAISHIIELISIIFVFLVLLLVFLSVILVISSVIIFAIIQENGFKCEIDSEIISLSVCVALIVFLSPFIFFIIY